MNVYVCMYVRIYVCMYKNQGVAFEVFGDLSDSVCDVVKAFKVSLQVHRGEVRQIRNFLIVLIKIIM